MALWIASDLHLSDCNEPLFRALESHLRSEVNFGDVVVFGGDIFDLFVGSKRVFVEPNLPFVALLKLLTERGAQVHYIMGNHDFFMDRAFSDVGGLKLHKDEVQIDYLGAKVYLAHGDLVDFEDHGYQRLRKFLRHPLTEKFIEKVPDGIVSGVGKVLKANSRGHVYRNTEGVSPLGLKLRAFGKAKLLQGFDYVFLGHSHSEDSLIEKDPTGKLKQYVNIGYPKQSKKILKLTVPGKEFEWVRLA